MFKNLRKKIEQGVAQSPLRAAIKPNSDAKTENDEPPEGTDGAGLEDSPAKMAPSSQEVVDTGPMSPTVGQLVDIPLYVSPLNDSTTNGTPLSTRSRQSSISSVTSESPFFPPLNLTHNAYDLPSEAESEMEESISTLDNYTKEDLYNVIKRLERRSIKYKGRFKDVVSAYKELLQDKEKIKNSLTLSQDKAFRRISELKEQAGLDRLAKKDLEENYRLMLEEKDEFVRVLQTQVRLLKEGKEIPADLESKAVGKPNAGDGDSAGSDPQSTAALMEKVKRQDSLLNRCKESIKSYKEKIANLSAEKTNLEKLLEEKSNEIDSKESSPASPTADSENAKLKKQIQQARQVIEDLEADKQLAIAETKQQMHEELESKDQEIINVKTTVQNLTEENQQLHEKIDKLQHSAEEKLQKSREIIKNLKEEKQQAITEMEQKLKQAEETLEKEKETLVQELSRGKSAAVTLLQQESEKRLEDSQSDRELALQQQQAEWEEKIELLKKIHDENLLLKDKEREKCLEQQEAEFQKRLADKQDEMKLSIEERDLQKMAALSQQDSAKDELLQQIEDLNQAKLEAENKMTKLIEDFETERSAWSKEREDYISKMDDLNQKHQSTEEKIKSEFEIKMQEQSQKYNEIQMQQIEELTRKHEETLQGSSSEVEDFYKAKLEALKTGHDQTLQEKTIQIDKLTQTIDDLKEKISVIQANYESQISAEIESKSALTEKYESEISKMKTNLQTQASLTEELQKKMEAQDIEMNALQTTFKGNLETCNSEWKQKLDEMQSEHEKQLGDLQQNDSTRVADAEKRVEELKKQIQEILSYRDALEEEKKSFQQERETLESTMASLNSQVENESHLVADLKEAIQKKDEEVEGLKKSVEEKITSLDLLDARCQDLDSQLAEKNKDIHNMQKKFGELKTEAKSRIQALKESTDKMAEDLNLRTEEVQSLSHKLEDAVQSKTDLAEQLKESQELQTALETSFKIKFEEKQNAYKENVQKMQESFQAQLTEKEMELQAKLEDLSREKEGATSDLENIRQKQLEELTRSHERQLQDTINSWEVRLSECKESYANQLQQIQQTCDGRISTLNETQESKLSELLSGHKAEMEELEQKCQQLADRLKQTEAALELVNSQKDQELAVIKEEISNVQNSSSSQVSVLQEEKQALIAEHNTALQAQQEQIISLSEELSSVKHELETVVEKHTVQIQEKDSHLQNATKEIQELKISKTSLQEALDNFNCANSEQVSIMAALKIEHQTVIDNLQAVIEEKKSLCEELQQKIQAAEEGSKDLEAVVEQLKIEKEQIISEFDNFKAEHSSSNSEKESLLESLQGKISSLELGLFEKEKAFAEINSLYESLEAGSREKDERMLEKTNQLEDVTEEIDRLKVQHEESLQRVQAEMGTKVSEQQQEMEERLRKALAEEERVKGELSVQIETLQVEHAQQMSDRDSELARLQQQVNVLEKSQDKIKNVMADSRDSFDAQASENLLQQQQKDREIHDLQEKLDSKNSEVEQLKEKIENIRQKALEKLQEQKNQITVKDKELNSLKESLGNIEAIKCAKEQEIDELLKKQSEFVERVRTQDAAHESAVESIREEYNARISDLTANDSELQEQLRHLREKLNETEERLHECIQTYDGQIQEYKAKLDKQEQSFNEEKSLLQQQLRDMDAQAKLNSEGLQESLQSKVREAEQTILEIKQSHLKLLEESEQQAANNLQELKQKYNSKLKEIKNKLTGRINELENLKETELSELNNKISDLEKGLQTEKSAKEALSIELVASNEKFANFETEIREKGEHSEGRILELTALLQDRDAEVTKLKKVTNDRENLVADLIKSQETAEEKAQTFDKEILVKDSEISALKEELKQKSDLAEELESKLQALSDDIGLRLETSEKRHADKMQEQLKSYAEAVEIAQNSTKELENELNNVHAQHRENLVKVSELENLVTQWKDKYEETQIALESTEKLRLKVEQTNSDCSAELSKLQSQHDEELRAFNEKLDSEGNSKVSEYKKKAESYLGQMKKQFQEDRDNLIKEKDLIIGELENKVEQLQSDVKQIQVENSEILSSFEAEREKLKLQFSHQLKEKESIIEENHRQSESGKQTQAELENVLETLKTEKDELNQKLLALDQEKSQLSQTLENKVKSLEKELSKTVKQFERYKKEKEEEYDSLAKSQEENLKKMQAEYEDERHEQEGKHSSQVKQLVKELNLKLAEKEQEFQETFKEAIGKSNRDEDRLMLEHKQMIEELHSDIHDKDTYIEEMAEKHALQIQEKEKEASDRFQSLQGEIMALQEKITLQSADHQRELQELEQKLEAAFEKRLADKMTKHQEEIDALTKEWNAERQIEFVSAENVHQAPSVQHQELVVGNQQSLSAIQSGSDSGELLRQQLIQQNSKMEDLKSKHKLEVAELRSQMEMGQNRQPLVAPPGHRNLFEEFEPRAAEEIQNLELHNMDLQSQVTQLMSELNRVGEREKELQVKLDESLNHSPGIMFNTPGASFHTPGASFHTPPSSPYPLSHNSTPLGPLLNEPTEWEYLKNILYQYMIGKETKTLAKVIATVMKFSDDQTKQIVAKEDSKIGWLTSP